MTFRIAKISVIRWTQQLLCHKQKAWIKNEGSIYYIESWIDSIVVCSDFLNAILEDKKSKINISTDFVSLTLTFVRISLKIIKNVCNSTLDGLLLILLLKIFLLLLLLLRRSLRTPVVQLQHVVSSILNRSFVRSFVDQRLIYNFIFSFSFAFAHFHWLIDGFKTTKGERASLLIRFWNVKLFFLVSHFYYKYVVFACFTLDYWIF